MQRESKEAAQGLDSWSAKAVLAGTSAANGGGSHAAADVAAGYARCLSVDKAITCCFGPAAGRKQAARLSSPLAVLNNAVAACSVYHI